MEESAGGSKGELEAYENFLMAKTTLMPRSITEYKAVIILLKRRLGKKQEDINEINRFLKAHQRSLYRRAIELYLVSRGKSIEDLAKIKPKPPKPRDVPKFNEFLQIIKTLDVEERYIALFLLNAGCRCHEAFKVKLKDIHPGGRVILETKGGKYRVIRLSDAFYGQLMHYLKDVKGVINNEYIFWTNRKSSNKSKGVMFWQILNKRTMELIKKHIGTHDFRRYYSMFIYRNCDKDLLLIQRLLGHADIKTTMRYLQHAITEKDIETAKKKVDVLMTKVSKADKE